MCARATQTNRFRSLHIYLCTRADCLVRIFSWPDTAAGRFPNPRLYIAYIIYARASMSSSSPLPRPGYVSASGRTAAGDRINYR